MDTMTTLKKWQDDYFTFMKKVEEPMVRYAGKVAEPVARYVPDRPKFMGTMPMMGEFVDKPIIYNGGSALPVLDVGQNPEPAADEPAANEEKPDTNKAFKLVKDLAQRYLYGRYKP